VELCAWRGNYHNKLDVRRRAAAAAAFYHFPTQEMLRTTARVLIPTTCSAHTRSVLFFLKEQRSVQNGPFACAMIRQSLGKFRARRRHSISLGMYHARKQRQTLDLHTHGQIKAHC
jgi:hypothetical protein